MREYTHSYGLGFIRLPHARRLQEELRALATSETSTAPALTPPTSESRVGDSFPSSATSQQVPGRVGRHPSGNPPGVLDDDNDVLAIRSNVAHWRGQSGDFAGARTTLEELLADIQRTLGSEHLRAFGVRSDLAYWRGQAGDPVGARNAFEQLVVDGERVLGAEHPDTLATRSHLAHWRGQAGDPVGARNAFEQLVVDKERVLGPDHPDTLATRSYLARWRGEAGDPVGATRAFEELLARSRA